MLTKTQALDEAQRQKQALASLGKWRRNLFIFTACILFLAVFQYWVMFVCFRTSNE